MEGEGSHKKLRFRVKGTRNLPPPVVRRIVEENPGRSKTELLPEDKIDITRIQGFEKGVRLDIEKGAKPEANYTTSQAPAQYKEPVQKLYQDWIKEGIVRLVQPDKKCNWVALSKVVTE